MYDASIYTEEDFNDEEPGIELGQDALKQQNYKRANQVSLEEVSTSLKLT